MRQERKHGLPQHLFGGVARNFDRDLANVFGNPAGQPRQHLFAIGERKIVGFLSQQRNIIQGLAQPHQDNAVAHDINPHAGGEIDAR